MADSRELGLFVPPDKETELRELEDVEQQQRAAVTRRMWFRWVGWGSILLLLGQWATGFIFGFFVPKRLGAFGGTIAAGQVSDYKIGDIQVFRDGQFYISHVPEGFLALWWHCPHLGCTVPWKPDEPAMGGPPGQGDLAFTHSGRFHCPCHGSIYNRYGQIIQGPAPRPMDLFPLKITGGKLEVQTGPSIARQRPVAQFSDCVKA